MPASARRSGKFAEITPDLVAGAIDGGDSPAAPRRQLRDLLADGADAVNENPFGRCARHSVLPGLSAGTYCAKHREGLHSK